MCGLDLFNEKIIKMNVTAKDSTDVIKQLGNILEQNNYINNSYIDSVLEREKSFPTGLALSKAGIAIPHASPDSNVFKNGIAAAHLTKPVKFFRMEDPDSQVDVDMVFMLALSGNEHLDILKKLFVAFQNEDLVESLKNSTDKQSFLQMLINNLK